MRRWLDLTLLFGPGFANQPWAAEALALDEATPAGRLHLLEREALWQRSG
jgi:hypothetical protein